MISDTWTPAGGLYAAVRALRRVLRTPLYFAPGNDAAGRTRLLPNMAPGGSCPDDSRCSFLLPKYLKTGWSGRSGKEAGGGRLGCEPIREFDPRGFGAVFCEGYKCCGGEMTLLTYWAVMLAPVPFLFIMWYLLTMNRRRHPDGVSSPRGAETPDG